MSIIGDGSEPIDDSELILRRIPANNPQFYKPGDARPALAAFTPSAQDITGLSLGRTKYIQVMDFAAKGRLGSDYYVAVLSVKELRGRGIAILPAPIGEGEDRERDHCEIPFINTTTNKHGNKAAIRVLMHLLASELCQRIDGPFPGSRAHA